MNDNQVTCDDAPLEAILRHDHSSEPSDDLLAHIETCTVCQARLSELAGPAAMWQDVKVAIAETAGSDQQRHFLLPAAHPNFAIALGHMAGLYQRTYQVDEALVLNEELFQLSPDDPDAINTIAWQIASSPDLDGKFPYAKQAVTWARRATELEPDKSAYQNALRVALYRAGRWQDACEALLKSIELGNDGPYNWLFLAMANWQLDQKDKAQQWYDKSLAWVLFAVVRSRTRLSSSRNVTSRHQPRRVFDGPRPPNISSESFHAQGD
jgi:tetratricopeptide (TPR) repeat protein